jgi:hypothetical protein
MPFTDISHTIIVTMKFTVSIAKVAGNKLGADWKKYSPATLLKGMNVELEHQDITHGDPVESAKIAMAHLKENPLYYQYLDKMEQTMTKETVAKKMNAYMAFCRENRAAVKGLSIAEQGRKLGELYRSTR